MCIICCAYESDDDDFDDARANDSATEKRMYICCAYESDDDDDTMHLHERERKKTSSQTLNTQKKDPKLLCLCFFVFSFSLSSFPRLFVSFLGLLLKRERKWREDGRFAPKRESRLLSLRTPFFFFFSLAPPNFPSSGRLCTHKKKKEQRQRQQRQQRSSLSLPLSLSLSLSLPKDARLWRGLSLFFFPQF